MASNRNGLLSAVCLGVLTLAGVGWGQVTGSSIAGSVKDSTGAVMPGVQVAVRNTETGIARTVQTDPAGRYLAPNLAPGNYEVQAELTGFQTGIRRGITLTLGREAVVDLTLSVGQVQEQVVVTGEASLVDTSSAAVTGLVDQQQVTDLPLNGRSMTQLTVLQPGILQYQNKAVDMTTGSGQTIVINGARTRQVNFLLNGTSTLNFFGKSPGGVSGEQLGVEGVREFTVLTSSYSAEFGRSAGGVINSITKSGTNTLHGSLYEYLRNSALDAAAWEDNAFLQGIKPGFKRNQFGASAGGPIRKDKTFFFANAEFLRESLGSTQSPNFPDAAARQGNLPGRPAFTVASSVIPYLNLMPLPNGQELGDGTARYNFALTQHANQNYVNGRMDHQFSESDSMFGSYVIDDSHSSGLSVIQGISDPNFFRSQYASVEESHIFSPTLLNTAHGGFNRSKTIDIHQCSDAVGKLSFTGLSTGPNPCFGFALSGIILPGIGTSPGADRNFVVNSFQYSDTLSWTKGNHSLKFGGSAERFRVNGATNRETGGGYSFANLASFLQANVNFFEAPPPGLNLWRGIRQDLLAFFANDSWRVRSNLTVNLGVRYEFITVPTEVNGKLANIPCLTCPARVGEPFFNNPSLHNFSPRIGVAWSPGAKQETSVRAGFGIFYDQLLHNMWLETPFSAPPFNVLARLTSTPGNPVPFPNAYSLFTGANISNSPSFVNGIEGNPHPTYMMQYNLSVQQQLPGQLVIMAAYVGSGGRHLARFVDNVAVPTIQPDGSLFFPVNSVRRNPNFQQLRYRIFDGTSSYNSVQLSARRRLARGYGFQVSYTFSKSLDTMSDSQGSGDLFNDTAFATLPGFPGFDRGRSAFDARHNFSANFTVDLPFGKNLTGVASKLRQGWQAQGIVSLQTGLPTAVLLAGTFDNARLQFNQGSGTERPNLNPGFTAENVVLGSPNVTKDPNGRYLNPLAFSVPAPGYFGNLGRGVFSGPGLASMDFSLIKNTAITERLKLEFRSEFFNLLNRPNFDYPSQQVFNSASGVVIGSFGTISSASRTSARQIQFALKVVF